VNSSRGLLIHAFSDVVAPKRRAHTLAQAISAQSGREKALWIESTITNSVNVKEMLEKIIRFVQGDD
jgi:hypothetical protein